MADFFNTIVATLSLGFKKAIRIEDLDTKKGKIKEALELFETYKKHKTYKREKDIIEPLLTALQLPSSNSIDQKENKIKLVEDELVKLRDHKLIIGSIFVGIGTAKYYSSMIRDCQSLKRSLEAEKKKTIK